MVMVMLQPMRNEIMMLVVVAMLKKALSPNLTSLVPNRRVHGKS